MKSNIDEALLAPLKSKKKVGYAKTFEKLAEASTHPYPSQALIELQLFCVLTTN